VKQSAASTFMTNPLTSQESQTLDKIENLLVEKLARSELEIIQERIDVVEGSIVEAIKNGMSLDNPGIIA
jgi:hypothetical protein